MRVGQDSRHTHTHTHSHTRHSIQAPSSDPPGTSTQQLGTLTHTAEIPTLAPLTVANAPRPNIRSLLNTLALEIASCAKRCNQWDGGSFHAGTNGGTEQAGQVFTRRRHRRRPWRGPLVAPRPETPAEMTCRAFRERERKRELMRVEGREVRMCCSSLLHVSPFLSSPSFPMSSSCREPGLFGVSLQCLWKENES